MPNAFVTSKIAGPDPFSFKKFHYLMHQDGTHALCVMAIWKISNQDFYSLLDDPASAAFISRREGERRYREGYSIYDVPVRIFSDGEQYLPELSFTNFKRDLSGVKHRR